jgi:N-carbamoylputrescine amidase
MAEFEAEFEMVTSSDVLRSPMRGDRPEGQVLRVGAVQCAWVDDPAAMAARVRDGVAAAASAGATIVFLQELTLSPYFCSSPDVEDALARFGEDLENGPTVSLLRSLAVDHGVAVHGSLYERTADGRGFNTAVCVDAVGVLAARTRKTHIPEFPYYHEHLYFEPSDDDPAAVEVGGVRYGFPTCWDQWFPELARLLSMDGAQVIVYPTAIGNEPHLPGMDSQPLWQQTIMANGLANSTFMVAVNRIGNEGPLSFYGSSFISDPYGRKLVEAPRDRPAVLVADLDLAQRDDMLGWGMMYTRRPERYAKLLDTSGLGRPLSVTPG